jgi:hypothetical protein
LHTELEEQKSSYYVNNCRVVVNDPDGNRIEFDADRFNIERITRRYTNGQLISIQWNTSFERIQSPTVTISTPDVPVAVPAPKYNAAMGDAAQEYCDELNAAGSCSGFRWEEVWKRMWEAQKK